MADHLYALPSGYRLESHEFKEVLSVGHYGIKYIGFDHHHDKQVAIKEYLPDGLAVRRDDTSVLPRSTADKATFGFGLSRFLDEAQMQSRLNEPSLVKIHQVLRANGTGYVVMDYVEGETLARILARRGTLPEEDMHAIIRPLLKPLELVHSMGFVHQDIRPSVIVLRADGSPVLLDLGACQRTLGSARQTFNDRKQSVNLSKPSAGFSALELYSDRGRLGPWTDIYSLGAVMYNCLTGQPPPDAPSRAIDDEFVIDAAKQTCAEQTLAAIESALAVPAGQRPSSIEAWRTKLPYGTAESEPQRPGHMARGTTRVAARGLGGAPRSRKKSGEVQSKRHRTWIFPTLAVAGACIMLTYVDGVLRSCEGADCNVATADTPVPGLPASLTVRTAPPDVKVFIGDDDKPIGSTPLDRTDLPAGEYRLTLSHPLYENMTVEEVLIGGKSTLVERTLVRATGALAVASNPPGAWIEVAGDLIGTTPTTLDNLPVGALTLTVGAQGYHTKKVATEVRKAGIAEVEVSLQSKIAYGTLTLALTPPDATVTMPDIVEHYTPGIQLPQGTYTVIVTRQGYRSETRSVKIAGDEHMGVALTIDPQPFTVATVPDGAAIRFSSRLASGAAYSPGMLLPPGRYRVQALLIGYRTWEETITHGATPTRREVALNPGIAEFADILSNDDAAPTMVLLESGQFRMGCLAGAGCRDNEGPVRTVNLPAPFALSKFEVTFNDYDRFTEATGHPRARNPRGWQRGDWPVVNVSWQDATAYVEWLTAETGRTYYLPSEAQWEYAARAGTETAYSWGDAVGNDLANCNGCGSLSDNVSPIAAGSFNANAWGLHDMHGNVWEWVQDCQLADYRDAPSDAAARESGNCKRRMLRGGSYSNSPSLIRVSIREWDDVSVRVSEVGFRVAASAE